MVVGIFYAKLTNSPMDKARNIMYLVRNPFEEKTTIQILHEIKTQNPTVA